MTPDDKATTLRQMPESALARMTLRIGESTFVVMNKAGSSVVQDPTTRLPFKTNNKKYAELVAKELGGVAVTWNEALVQLTKYNNPHKKHNGNYVSVNPKNVVSVTLMKVNKLINEENKEFQMSRLHCHSGVVVVVNSNPSEVTRLFNSQS
jgi:hypothetical protein